MTRGGIESRLMDMLRNIDRERVHMDFLVGSNRPCAYDDEIRSLGSLVIPGARHRRPLAFARGFYGALREHGPYHAGHSHVGCGSGWVLRLASRARVPVRIAHGHNDRREEYARARGLRGLYFSTLTRWVRKYATSGLGCSAAAVETLFGPGWREDSRCRVLPYGLELAPFEEPVDPGQVREELGIPLDAFVIGHVGNLRPQKNHSFIIDIAAELVRPDPDCRFLLVGRDVDETGRMRAMLEAKAERLGVSGNVLFAGERADVPRLMRGAMDAFIFPSFYEGLGMVLIEAQAAGLPCVMSDVMQAEVEVVPELLRSCSLEQSASEWADALSALRDGAPVSREQALEAVRASPYNIAQFVRTLEAIYGA